MISYSDQSSSDIPSSIRWSQTSEAVTLLINVNHVQVTLTDKCLKLSTKNQNITLPLYSSLYIQQIHIEQMMNMNDKIGINSMITIEKECSLLWPHLLMQQTDEEVTNYLLEANFLLQIHHLSHNYDTLDFETVINSHGQKTGLE